ncbi:MAG: AMP-binding protein [Lactobacillus sp.]|nr:AMP-binding protein [Lactobacillus sp.]
MYSCNYWYTDNREFIENELQIVGDMVFDGYLNRKKETAKSFIEINAKKAYKTGDKVRILDNGYIFLMVEMIIKLRRTGTEFN